jgi:hypothetical protein
MAIEFWLCKMIIRRCQGFAPWLRCDFSVKPLTPDMGRIKIILQEWQVCDWLYHARKKNAGFNTVVKATFLMVKTTIFDG